MNTRIFIYKIYVTQFVKPLLELSKNAQFVNNRKI